MLTTRGLLNKMVNFKDIDTFAEVLNRVLIKERCTLLNLVRAMLEDPGQAVKKFPLDSLRNLLLEAHQALAETVDVVAKTAKEWENVVNLRSLNQALSVSRLKECLSEALLLPTTKKAATQSLITLAMSLPGSGMSEGLALSPFAPMPQEVLALTPTSGTTASSSKEIADVLSSPHSRMDVETLEEHSSLLKQLDIADISEPSRPKSCKRKLQEDSIIYSGGYNNITLIKVYVMLFYLQVLPITRTGERRSSTRRKVQATS